MSDLDNAITITAEQIASGDMPPPPDGYEWHTCDLFGRPLLGLIDGETVYACGHVVIDSVIVDTIDVSDNPAFADD